ncbi:MAG: response regulator [Chloroflexota bacterium]
MLTVLVVDDDPDMRLLTRRLLTMLGCESSEARNGIEAETIALATKPDLILLDIMMPVRDGYETCLRLREQNYSGAVILMSAMQEATGKARAAECGATAFMQKPMTRISLKFHVDFLESQQIA